MMYREDDGAVLKTYEPLVSRIARYYIMRLPANVELSDVMQEGRIGLLDAIHRFDDQQDASFESYATQRIKGSILDYLRKMDFLGRATRREYKKIEKATARIENRLGRKARASEIAAFSDMDLAHYNSIVLAVEGSRFVGLGDGDNDSESDFSNSSAHIVRDLDADPFERYAKTELWNIIGRSLETLPAQQRFVIESIVGEGKRGEDAARVLGVTPSRVSQIFVQAAKAIRPYVIAKDNLATPGQGNKDGIGAIGPVGRFRLPDTFFIAAVNTIEIPPHLAQFIRDRTEAKKQSVLEKPNHLPFAIRFKLPTEFQLTSVAPIQIPAQLAENIRDKRAPVKPLTVGRTFSIVAVTPLHIPDNLAEKIAQLSCPPLLPNTDIAPVDDGHVAAPKNIKPTTTTERDMALLSKALEGDMQSFAKYLMFQQERIVKYGQWKGLTEADAEDMFSVAIMKVMDAGPEKIESHAFQDAASLRNWTQVIFSHQIMDMHRRNKVRNKAVTNAHISNGQEESEINILDVLECEGSEGLRGPEEVAIQMDLRSFMTRVFESAAEQGTKYLDIFFEYTIAKDADSSAGIREIAEKYGMSEGTVKTHGLRARKWLEENFGAEARSLGII